MQITRTSILSGITRTRDVPITHAQFAEWQNGALIQYAFPQLSDSDREFLMTGVTDEEWNEVFGEEED